MERSKSFKPYVNHNTLCAYNALILPHFDYYREVCDTIRITPSDRIQRLQNRAARVITGRKCYRFGFISLFLRENGIVTINLVCINVLFVSFSNGFSASLLQMFYASSSNSLLFCFIFLFSSVLLVLSVSEFQLSLSLTLCFHCLELSWPPPFVPLVEEIFVHVTKRGITSK